jgi:hypothetical protein
MYKDTLRSRQVGQNGRKSRDRIANRSRDDDNQFRYQNVHEGSLEVDATEKRGKTGRNVRMGVSVAGYSGSPLAKKLGIKPGMCIHVVDPPVDYAALANPLPENVVFSTKIHNELDLVHVFIKSRSRLVALLRAFQGKIKQDGIIWVSWPKKSSSVSSEVSEDTIREVALPLGLVDVKVCAVDETWSGLKLVIRKENRKSQRSGGSKQ